MSDYGYVDVGKLADYANNQATGITANEIMRFPRADVQLIIHAKWVLFDKDCVGRAFYCSNCRKVTTTDDFEDTPLDRDEYFCMRCGADMREPKPIKG